MTFKVFFQLKQFHGSLKDFSSGTNHQRLIIIFCIPQLHLDFVLFLSPYSLFVIQTSPHPHISLTFMNPVSFL